MTKRRKARIVPCPPDKPGHGSNGFMVHPDDRGALLLPRRRIRPTDSGPIEVVDASDAEIPPPEHANGFGDEETQP